MASSYTTEFLQGMALLSEFCTDLNRNGGSELTYVASLGKLLITGPGTTALAHALGMAKRNTAPGSANAADAELTPYKELVAKLAVEGLEIAGLEIRRASASKGSKLPGNGQLSPFRLFVDEDFSWTITSAKVK